MPGANPDFLIVGGGIIGCSLARELARTGAQVVVVERGRVGSSCPSFANLLDHSE